MRDVINTMEEILKFKFDGNMYELYRDSNVLKCSKLVGYVHDFNLSEDEKKLVKEVYNEVIPSNEIVLLGNFNHDNNNFMHFIDKKNSMNIFYQIEGNRLIAPKKEALSYLNCTFNNQNEYLCEGNIKNTTQKYFKRIIKVTGKTVVVFVTSLALFVTPVLAQSEIDTDISPINTSSSVTLYKAETPKKSEISVKEIEDLIRGNKNLSVEEKELALSCPEFFKENSKLMDGEVIKSRLSNLVINYH